MSSGRTLPIRVAPLPGEPLDGWLEAYAHRLDVTFGDLLAALGLRIAGRQAPDYTVYLRQQEAERITALTGVPVEQAHAMMLRLFDGHVVALHPRRRAVTRSTWWSRGSGSRFCPRCLTERDGRWLLRWRLAWVFACTRHRMLLLDVCPGCGHSPRTSVMRITYDHRPGTCPRRGCGTDLRETHPRRLRTHDRLLVAQAWIDTILDTVEAGTTDGVADAPAAVFTDLRTVAGWLLRQSDPEDFHSFGARIDAAWQAACGYYAGGVRPSQFPPTDAALMGATASRAIALIDGDDDTAITHLRTLLLRSPHRTAPPSAHPA
ncbi:TniQ family protein [Kutzneria sp. NPDC052558]|uniref:TniQ family protein n=1 Tax=Kutzneria sp. NPDC052558 TaxID=3364121 RepID=UPI0037C7B35A